jgi:N-sulfoglucosamine sulfohydrolase
MKTHSLLFYSSIFLLIILGCKEQPVVIPEKPNILFIIADDWSYPHAGIYGDSVVKTPNFDRIAREGILFDHAYVASPSCTPSRAAILAGQHVWRLQEGANLYGPLQPEIPTYTQLLEESGYHVGYSNKGWAPGEAAGRSKNPAGEQYESFASFLEERKSGTPFCYWFGSFNPHRGYEKGSGKEAGIPIDQIKVPGHFPDNETVRNDMADYYLEVQAFDEEIGKLLDELTETGELDHTIIVVTSDNGMPFPRSKANLYDWGTRVPLAIRWGNQFGRGFRSQDFVSLTDLAPTFLELAELPIPPQMTGKSLLSIPVTEDQSAERTRVFFGRERHVPGQEAGDFGGYPSRAIRTHDYLYIKNFRPDRWPAGTGDYEKASFFPSFYGDVDGGPTRTNMVNNRNENADYAKLFELAFAKRPEEELYDLKNDPDQLVNLAESPDFLPIKKDLAQGLMDELTLTGDPRAVGGEETFESYPYTGGTPFPDHFQWETPHYATEKITNFPSKYTRSRDIEILLPVNVSYDKTFPVLYMFDGQNLFHSFTGWGGEENKGWRVDEVLDSLFVAGTIPQVIVVGIHNNDARMAEYMPAKPKDLIEKRIAETKNEWEQSFRETSPNSDNQLRFLVEELKPFIDQKYRTKPGRENTFIAGSSMGGLISAYAICEYPEIFGGAACISTHWLPLEGVFLEYIKGNLPDPATHKLYFDHGTKTLDSEYGPYQKIADEIIAGRGYIRGQNWITEVFKGAKHHEDDWNARFHIPMEFLLGKKEAND